MHVFAVALLAMTLLAVAAPARAASGQEKAVASQLFDDADRLLSAGKVSEACPKFAESHRLDPQIGTLLHLGECYEHLGRTASAWASFKEASEMAASRGDLRAPKISEHLRELDAKVPRVVLTVAETAADLEVRQDGELVNRAIWGSAVPIDPGTHIFEARASGRVPWKTSLQIQAKGTTNQVAIPKLSDTSTAAFTPLPSAAPPPPKNEPAKAAPVPEQAMPPPPRPPLASPAPAPEADKSATNGPQPGARQRLLGWVGVGVGVVALAAGTVFEIQRGNKLSDRDAICPSSQNCTREEGAEIKSLESDAKTAATLGAVSLTAGALLVGGGLALVFTAPRGEPSTRSASLVPIVGPGFGGISVSGRIW